MRRVKSLPPTDELPAALAAMDSSSNLEEVDEHCERVVETALALCVMYSRFEGDKRELARGLREISIVLDHAAEREEILAPVVQA